ncbi:MAG TPA: hypothetical protein DEF21_17865 [Thalassospira lucentensis]|uniref:Uncharacterized protein n=1 Tax=Thalassospira lucentensis TaxID=168935 RepID=A0A358HX48_9PROT|nr:hypothetical protein [Thalassospira lucentensis]
MNNGDALTDNYQIFIRDTFEDDGSIPSPSETACVSPDIVTYGINPLNDPNELIVEDWNKDINTPVVKDYRNYVYIRGSSMNIPEGQDVKGEIHLYYTKATLLLLPETWQRNIIPPQDPEQTPFMIASENGQHLYAQNPFKWLPEEIGEGDHYCLIARVTTEEAPNPVPREKFANSGAFTDWIRNNPGMAWRNVTLVSGPPSIEQAFTFEFGNADPVEEKHQIQGISENFSPGTRIHFSCEAAGVNPPINTSHTIVDPENDTWNIPVTLEGELTAPLTVTIECPFDAPLSLTGASLKVKLMRSSNGGQFSEDQENDRLLNLYAKPASHFSITSEEKLVQMGECTIKFA